MILDGHYTHASDVWAFGILAWELYTSFSIDRRDLRLSVPYNGLYNHEVKIESTACHDNHFRSSFIK